MAGQRAAPQPQPVGRAGRNLPAAIAVGVALAAVITVPLYLDKPVFAIVLGAAVAVGTWEFIHAVGASGVRPARLPLFVGGGLMIALAYLGGTQALVVALALTVLGCLVWRLPLGPQGYLPDFAVSTLIAVYVPFLASFCALLLAQEHGAYRVTTFIATTVCSDIGGYAVGVLAGRHPMAPSVSPKKSWEGFAGSMLACMASGVIFLVLLLDAQWWEGVVFGAAVVCTATLGDLGESMIKRDLGIKDMSNLLAGHGGMMDRLDSLLTTAPAAWLLLTAFAPSH